MLNKFFIISFFWTLLITILSLITIKTPLIETEDGKDKWVHFTFYFGFVFFWSLTFKKISLKKVAVVFWFSVLYGAFLEWCQHTFTTTRKADFYDIIANSVGALLAFILILFLNQKKIFNNSNTNTIQ